MTFPLHDLLHIVASHLQPTVVGFPFRCKI